MANITVEQLEQKYKIELELMEGREGLKAIHQDKLTNAVKRDNYLSVIKEIESNPERNTFQALGKGYILRKNDLVIKDYKDLLEECDKTNTEYSVIELYLEKIRKDVRRSQRS